MKRGQFLKKTIDFLNKKIAYWLVLLFMGFVLFVTMYNNVKPISFQVEKLTIAEETIRSPITIEDVEQTERKKREAVNQVKPQYVLKQEYAQNRVDLIRSIFDSSIDLQDDLADDQESHNLSTEEKIDLLKEKLTKEVTDDLSDATLEALVTSSKTDLSLAKDAVVTAVNKIMTNRIPASEVENSKNQVEDELSFTILPEKLKLATIELGRYAIIQNEFYDSEATEELRQQAMESVEPVLIKQGQIIVEEGQLVSQEIFRQLELLGFTDSNTVMKPYIGLIIFILLLLAIIYFNFTGNRLDWKNNKGFLIFTVTIIASVVFMKGISLIPLKQYDIGYLFPAAITAMMLKIFLNDRSAFTGTIILALAGAIIFNNQATGAFHITMSLYILISGLSGMAFLTKQNHRSKILQAGLFVSVINILVIIALLFIPNSKFSTIQYLIYVVMGFVSGIGSSILTIGFIPFFEAGFGILSTMKLIELSNPNHPLLKKILTEAPGTYHHSVMVANIADSACEAVGANGLLARVASYYHDIGKTVRPNFFIENQMNIDNPHDKLPPETSKDIIIAHTADGAKILKKHKMPKEIIDVAEQHHGTSLLKYFYHKAKEAGQEVEEQDFRYPGPKPQTKEVAIISIADSVEAAVRSIPNPSMEKIESLVKNIIKDKLNDDQFTECDLTLKELKIIEKTICETLYGTFHNRIEYPELKKE